VEASVDSFFGESPEVERKSLSLSGSQTSLSDESDSEASTTTRSGSSSSGESTARSSSSSISANSKKDFEPEPEVDLKDNDKAEMSEPEETKEPQPAVPVRGSMESEGDLTDISPMVTPRPSGATEQNQLVDSIDVNDDIQEGQGDIRVSVNRPKSAHPSRSRGQRKPSTSSSDLNHLLEAVLVLDQKMADRDQAKDPNPFPPRAVGGSRASSARGSRKSSFTADRQREIQKENERLLRELTKQKSRRPMSAVSATSIRSATSSRSQMSGISAASAIEFRKTANCRAAPIARNYHSRINRTKEAKRIDEENLALLRRLQNVRASPAIQMSRQAVMRPRPVSSRPRSARPKIVNTWTDGW